MCVCGAEINSSRGYLPYSLLQTWSLRRRPRWTSPTEESKNCAGESKKTLLFVISDNPWKGTVMLPSKHGFSLRDVRDALEEESILTPDFPKGEFEVIRGYKDFQVAIFKYDRDSVAGCRTTSSKQHRA